MLEIRLPYRPANLFEDAVMTQCPANHGEPPPLPAILFRTPIQVNAKGLLWEVHAAEERRETRVVRNASLTPRRPALRQAA